MPRTRYSLADMAIRLSRTSNYMSKTPFIISTCDIDNSDSFLALAKYAHSGIDTMLVVNYPAYLNNESVECVENSYGLGYSYGMDAFCRNYPDTSRNTKKSYTDIIATLVKRIWIEEAATGTLYVMIGGINTTNSYSSSYVRNEMKLYSSMFPVECNLYPYTPSTIFQLDENTKRFVQTNANPICPYHNIYIDFNGSMAWLRTVSYDILDVISQQTIFSVVSGGVLVDETPKTMPAIPSIINRFSCATRNQACDAQAAKLFYDTFRNSYMYVITDNIVEPEDSFQHMFFRHSFHSPTLRSICNICFGIGSIRVHGLCSAIVLVNLINTHPVSYVPHRLFYESKYGINLVALSDDTYQSALRKYKISLSYKADASSDYHLAQTVKTELKHLDQIDPSVFSSILVCTPMSINIK